MNKLDLFSNENSGNRSDRVLVVVKMFDKATNKRNLRGYIWQALVQRSCEEKEGIASKQKKQAETACSVDLWPL